MGVGTLFYQLFEQETSTYTYLIADDRTLEGVLIDPVLERVERDLKLINELGVKLRFVLETHVHADHITGAGEIALATRAKIAISNASGIEAADVLLEDGQELRFGRASLKALATPGHTDCCMCFLVGDSLFTGDTLLIRGNGRTDFQQGSASRLYQSITEKLYRLPDETLVYPAHDYNGQTHSTIGMEKRFNARISQDRTEVQFLEIMAQLKLADPKKLKEAVPANLKLGLVRAS